MSIGTTTARGQWGNRIGFILATAGSAIGLGNIWKFPYITGTYGGGLFVLIYLACIAGIGLPIMIAAIILGRSTQRSPVGAFSAAAGTGTAWHAIGWTGVVAGFVILSYYSVVAGWAMNYALMSISSAFTVPSPTGPVAKSAEEIGKLFATLYAAGDINLFWHAAFMLITVSIVAGGVQKGIEAWSRVLMPALFVLLAVLLGDAVTLDGFTAAASFVFAPNPGRLSAAGILEALGHSFFTLSLGMGVMITYGSYLGREEDLVRSSVLVCALDTAVALMACLIMFPIIFTFGMEPSAGPGLVFVSMPIAFSQMTGGMVLSILFFVLLVFAALTSAISLLEVVTATFIDQLGWRRRKAVLITGGLIFLLGIPSALSGAGGIFADWGQLFGGKNFFDTMDYLASNWLLPLGGLGIAVFVGWVMPEAQVREEFQRGSSLAGAYPLWRFMLRYVVPVAIVTLFLFWAGILDKSLLAGSAA